MYEKTIFIRTPEGNQVLSNKELQLMSYKVHLVLKLCDGKYRYDFLEKNMKRVDDLADIIDHLLKNKLITELSSESKSRFQESEAVSAQSYKQVDRMNSLETALDHSLDQSKSSISSTDNQRNHQKAISIMSNALTEFFSEDVLEWSMQSESCKNNDDLELLISHFQAIYQKNTNRSKANNLVKQVRELI